MARFTTNQIPRERHEGHEADRKPARILVAAQGYVVVSIMAHFRVAHGGTHTLARRQDCMGQSQ